MPVDDGSRIVAFYEGTAPDDRGRFLEEILSFDDARVEHVHDFIQWLFPLPEVSGANPSAPILDDGAINAFLSRPELRAALRRSLDRMLAFYGLRWSGQSIVKERSFPGTSNWLSPENHNHLRLTRILRSLCVLGERPAAEALFEALRDIYDDDQTRERNWISGQTFQFWSSAVKE
ncbi:MAG: hypothetical protein JO263_07455 [Candidatus Eremiobacteraeota bacterium]|nr:hypothetical protein [Candidatus Eremiobacteraeota bacterium]